MPKTDGALSVIKAFGTGLTARQLWILQTMRDEEGEIMQCNLSAYVGEHPLSARSVLALLRAAAISVDQFSDKACKRYTINATGLNLLEKEGK
jgi:hypothetical protein